MKKLLLAIAMAGASAAAFANPGDTTTELMGFETVKVSGQEIRLEVTKETTADGKQAICRQYVESFKREENTDQGGDQAKTTIVLGKMCKENKKG
ncbi:hypothetical protein QU487_06770 [Crenobacter sp. SG2305]|uniref:hypothetical protein n=1 Tax=Crenobacter oryzisoli TaxID=3056844 RepID=UPI0025AA58F8|nr:hypothetical protein [Crenobacter sp. SG2305]MDN0082457.1 hypothetical protein [Crenobacter sp. SG2305]